MKKKKKRFSLFDGIGFSFAWDGYGHIIGEIILTKILGGMWDCIFSICFPDMFSFGYLNQTIPPKKIHFVLCQLLGYRQTSSVFVIVVTYNKNLNSHLFVDFATWFEEPRR